MVTNSALKGKNIGAMIKGIFKGKLWHASNRIAYTTLYIIIDPCLSALTHHSSEFMSLKVSLIRIVFHDLWICYPPRKLSAIFC